MANLGLNGPETGLDGLNEGILRDGGSQRFFAQIGKGYEIMNDLRISINIKYRSAENLSRSPSVKHL